MTETQPRPFLPTWSHDSHQHYHYFVLLMISRAIFGQFQETNFTSDPRIEHTARNISDVIQNVSVIGCADSCASLPASQCAGLEYYVTSQTCILLSWNPLSSRNASTRAFPAPASAAAAVSQIPKRARFYRRQLQCQDYDSFNSVEKKDSNSSYCLAAFNKACNFACAKNLCEQMGASLVHLDSLDKLAAMKMYIRRSILNRSYNQHFWVGVRKEQGTHSAFYYTRNNVTIDGRSDLWYPGALGRVDDAPSCGFVGEVTDLMHKKCRDKAFVMCEVILNNSR